MKKQAVITAVLFLLVSVAASFGQDQQVRRPRLRANIIQEMLDLTPGQAEALKNLRMEHQKKRLALTDKIRLLSLENRQLMRDPETNAVRSQELRRQIFELREMNYDQMLAHRKARNALLTAEQLEKMKALESRRSTRQRADQPGRLAGRGRPDRMGSGRRGYATDRNRREAVLMRNNRLPRLRRDMN